jgi:hypothetical protein
MFGQPGQSGTTSFTWNATNPSPSGSCGGYTPVSSQTYTGTITNDGCDVAGGTWSNSSNLSGGFSMTKPSDLPDGNPTEITNAIQWDPTYPTQADYEGAIQTSKSFAGRQVAEHPTSPASDACWFQGSGVDEYVLSGGGWFVGYLAFDSKYDYDIVGLTPDAITIYRKNSRTPCLISAPQTMSAYTRATLSSDDYYNDTLYISLPDQSWVGVSRGGLQAWRTWP